ncbi:MAG: STAS domain-containing protein [Gemmatimonadaceae bacterium]
MSASIDCEVLTAPPRIVSETRMEFRKAALAFIEGAEAAGAPAVCVDLSETLEVDASGLGILVIAQKRSKELGLPLRLINVPSQVRYLLVLTKLDHLFEIR